MAALPSSGPDNFRLRSRQRPGQPLAPGPPCASAWDTELAEEPLTPQLAALSHLQAPSVSKGLWCREPVTVPGAVH